MTEEQYEQIKNLNKEIQDKFDEIKKVSVESTTKLQQMYEVINNKQDELNKLMGI